VQQTTPRKPNRPVLWIVVGPNGSGKSSLYNRSDIEGWGGSVWIINPDLLTVKIVEQEKLAVSDANLAAVQRIEAWLEASIEAYQTIGVETVLSSSKYQRLVLKAKDNGFEVRMIYVVLKSAEIQAKRIKIRVSEGGHDVPADKIAARRQRSFVQLAWFLKRVDQCFIFDNSDGEPDVIAMGNEGILLCYPKLPKGMKEKLEKEMIKIAEF
jgi:predicted ABC-type ATPase